MQTPPFLGPRHFGVQVWDFLVGVLVFFPLLTGGLWIQRPHLFLELSDVGLSVFIVGFIAVILKCIFRVPLERSWTLGVVIRLWRAWSESLEKKTGVTLGWASFTVGALWSFSSYLRHQSFESHAFDLGIFSNAVWHLLQGEGPRSSVKEGISLLVDHQSPLLAAMAPIYAIFPNAQNASAALLIAQGFGLALGALPLFYLGRQHRAGAWCAALPLFYWAWLPLRNANAFDFHPEVFMLPLFLGAIAGLQSVRLARRWIGVICLILALAGKESAGAVAFGVGAAWCMGAGPIETRGFTRKMGIFAIFLGLTVFIFDIKMVPGFFGAQYAYQDSYTQYGGGLGQLVLAPLTHPLLFLSQLLGPARLKFLFFTLAPLGFLPLLNPRVFFAALPGYFMLFLSAGDHRVNLGYHYAIEPGVGLFWALPGACAAFTQWNPGARKRQIAFLCIVFVAASTFGRSEVFRIRRNIPTGRDRWVTSQVLPCVNPALSVAASEALVPHLASREWIHPLDSILDQQGKPVSCVIEDRSIGNFPMVTFDFEKLSVDLTRFQYRPAYRCGTLQVFALPGDACLTCNPACFSD